MTLSTSSIKKYTKELNFFKEKINKINLPNAKSKGIVLINELETQMKLIENGHSSTNNGYIRPTDLRDTIVNCANIRKQLHKLIQETN